MSITEVERAPEDQYMSGDQVEEYIATISGHIAIACDIEGLNDIAVATTHTEIQDTITKFSKDTDLTKCFFKGTYKNISNWIGKTEEVYEKGGDEWDNFCSDLVLYYCARAVLLNRPIPILSTVPKDACLTGKFRGKASDLPKIHTLMEGEAVVNTLQRVLNADVVSAEIIDE